MPIKSYEDMRLKKAEVSRSLDDLAGVVTTLNQMGVSISTQALIELKKRIDNDAFKVLVIGEFKNGKSTFINALLGEKNFAGVFKAMYRCDKRDCFW